MRRRHFFRRLAQSALGVTAFVYCPMALRDLFRDDKPISFDLPVGGGSCFSVAQISTDADPENWTLVRY